MLTRIAEVSWIYRNTGRSVCPVRVMTGEGARNGTVWRCLMMSNACTENNCCRMACTADDAIARNIWPGSLCSCIADQRLRCPWLAA